jgi:hypothetical protein
VYFAEFFLLAYEQPGSDANGDGRVTVLEAFSRAAHRCINWYHRQYKVEAPEDESNVRCIEVRTEEARRIFAKFYEGDKKVRMMKPAGADESEDQEPSFAKLEDLPLRRESPEHASLDDRGESVGAMHWVANKHEVLKGEPGQEGETAARTVLGSPEPLPAPK